MPKIGEYEMYAKYSAKPAYALWNVGKRSAGLLFAAEQQGWGGRMGGRTGGGARPFAGRGEGGKEVEDGQQDTQ